MTIDEIRVKYPLCLKYRAFLTIKLPDFTQVGNRLNTLIMQVWQQISQGTAWIKRETHCCGHSRHMKHKIIDIYNIVTKRFTKVKTRSHITIKKLRKGPYRASSYISLVLRPLLEHERIKLAVSAPIMAALITTSFANITPNDLEIALQQTQEVSIQETLTREIKPPSASDSEQTTYLMPVNTLTGISQQYHLGHKGIDLRSPLGSNVIAMEDGVVTTVKYEKFGYGHHVYINHSATLKTLYAHLDQVFVHSGQQISAGDSIGTIGTTGRSTGPHLHFEVHESDDSSVNPLNYIR